MLVTGVLKLVVGVSSVRLDKDVEYHVPVSTCDVTLGRKDAVGQFTHGDDTPRRVYITGRTAVAAKEMASRGGKFNPRSGGF